MPSDCNLRFMRLQQRQLGMLGNFWSLLSKIHARVKLGVSSLCHLSAGGEMAIRLWMV